MGARLSVAIAIAVGLTLACLRPALDAGRPARAGGAAVYGLADDAVPDLLALVADEPGPAARPALSALFLDAQRSPREAPRPRPAARGPPALA